MKRFFVSVGIVFAVLSVLVLVEAGYREAVRLGELAVLVGDWAAEFGLAFDGLLYLNW